MNIRKSITITMAFRGLSRASYARELGISNQYLGKMINDNSASIKMIELMARHSGLEVSQFIKLGEEK